MLKVGFRSTEIVFVLRVFDFPVPSSMLGTGTFTGSMTESILRETLPTNVHTLLSCSEYDQNMTDTVVERVIRQDTWIDHNTTFQTHDDKTVFKIYRSMFCIGNQYIRKINKFSKNPNFGVD